jgi:predicted nucleotidyltransferase
METIKEPIRSVLQRHQDIKLCIVFGSIAAGKASSKSDLDIAVAGEQPLDGDKFLELTAEFSAATNREIDLLDLMTATGLILKQALSTGQIVQNHNKSLYAKLISQMLFNEADMMPYYHRILRERRKRFLNG